MADSNTERTTPVADATRRDLVAKLAMAYAATLALHGHDPLKSGVLTETTAALGMPPDWLACTGVLALSGAALETQDGQLRELNTELLKANLLNSVLYEALKPFAASFEALVSNTRIAWGRRDWNEHMPGHWTIDIAVTMNDGRRAREALSQAERGRGADVAVERSTPVSLRATPKGEPA